MGQNVTQHSAKIIAFNKEANKSRQRQRQQYLIGNEQAGRTIGVNPHLTGKKTRIPDFSVDGTSVLMSSIVAEELSRNSNLAAANTSSAPSGLNLASIFDGAGVTAVAVTPYVLQELKGIETRFQQDFAAKEKGIVPELLRDVHEVFAEQQNRLHEMADKEGLRVGFDKGLPVFAHDMEKIERLQSTFDSHVHQTPEPSIQVLAFTQSASSNRNTLPVIMQKQLREQEAPAPVYRPKGMALAA